MRNIKRCRNGLDIQRAAEGVGPYREWQKRKSSVSALRETALPPPLAKEGFGERKVSKKRTMKKYYSRLLSPKEVAPQDRRIFL